MVTFPPCKINLGLQVLSKRTDGYHDIATCFYPLPWTDVLEILPSDVTRLTLTGISIPGSGDNNLCLKAYQLLKNDFKLSPVQVHLHKIIPAGAGLGGGSSDAAHALRQLNEIFALKLSAGQLMKYASRLGSDCAFFVQNNPMTGTGRGEILEGAKVNLKGHFLVLLTPDIHVSTAGAYAGVVPSLPKVALREIVEGPMSRWNEQLTNDFETSVFRQFPAIQKLKEKLYSLGAVYASMSGSGSSVYGIFKEEIKSSEYFRDVKGWSGWL
jgi:4-diphosphocytidyl-2-C-methyl-D-erythritol kinase